MNKHILTLAGVLALAAAPAFAAQTDAQTKMEVQADVNASAGAVAKDEAAIQKQQQTLEENRASKEANKAEGDIAGQAIDSVKIGANHTGIAAKKVEKKVDEKILESDRNNLNATEQKGAH